MGKKKLLLILILIIVTFSCSKKILEEKEPNNSFEQANPIELNSHIRGVMNDPMDLDVYVLDLRSYKGINNTLSIELIGIKGFDLQFSIFKNKKLIKIIDDQKKNEGERFDNLNLTKDLYHIVVSFGKLNNLYLKERQDITRNENIFPTSPYELILKPYKADHQELEPNDHPSQANQIFLNKPIKGFYSPFKNPIQKSKNHKYSFDDPLLKRLAPYDFDWYYFSINKNGSHKVSITLKPTPLVDSIIVVYQKNRIILMNNNGLSGGERITNLEVEGFKKYYILVVGVPHEYKISSREEYPYELTVQMDKGSQNLTESEPNDKIEDANIFIKNYIRGYLSPKSDKDFYKIDFNQQKLTKKQIKKKNPANKEIKEEEFLDNLMITEDLTATNKNESTEKDYQRKLSVKLKGVPGVDLELRLYDSSGKLLRVYDNTGEGEDEVILNYNISEMDSIYLSVQGSKNNKNENHKDYYELTYQITNYSFGEEIEPNDNPMLPNILDINQKIRGFIDYKNDKSSNQKGDKDVYEIRLDNESQYYLYVTSIKNIPLKITCYYTLNDQKMVIDKILDDKKSRLYKFLINTEKSDTLSDQVYHIVVQSMYGNKSSISNYYNLQVKKSKSKDSILKSE